MKDRRSTMRAILIAATGVIAILMLVWLARSGRVEPSGDADFGGSAGGIPTPGTALKSADSTAEVDRQQLHSSASGKQQQPDGHRHADPEKVLFDLSLPRASRALCDSCDPYRKRLSHHFSTEERELLDDIASFSEYVPNEVWRVAAERSEFIAAAREIYPGMYADYERAARNLGVEKRRVAQSRFADGAFESYYDRRDVPSPAPGVVLHVRSRYDADAKKNVFEVVRIYPGDDPGLDSTIQARMNAKIAMRAVLSDLIERYVR